jgi:hypothetical protein
MFVISFKQKLPNELFSNASKKTLKLLSNLLFQLSNSTNLSALSFKPSLPLWLYLLLFWQQVCFKFHARKHTTWLCKVYTFVHFNCHHAPKHKNQGCNSKNAMKLMHFLVSPQFFSLCIGLTLTTFCLHPCFAQTQSSWLPPFMSTLLIS